MVEDPRAELAMAEPYYYKGAEAPLADEDQKPGLFYIGPHLSFP